MSMMKRILCLLILVFSANVLQAQTVLFDGIVNESGESSAMLVPVVITGNDYSILGRYEYGVSDRVNVFGLLGGSFGNGGRALVGGGWTATILSQTGDFPANFGFFNSIVAPIESGGPDVLITLAPLFSRKWESKSGNSFTGYIGATATLQEGNNNPRSRGRRTNVNLLVGVEVPEVAAGWDFLLELQGGEKSQFAVGFQRRF